MDFSLDQATRESLAELQIWGREQVRPVGLEAVAASLSEDVGTLEDMVEPFLLQIGFLARTRRGRQLTAAAAEHLSLDLKIEPSSDKLVEE